MALNKFLKSQAGLTIVELLIAATIMMFVLAIGYNFLFLNYRAYQDAENLAEVQFDVRMASSFITGELRNVSEISLTDDSLDHQIDLTLLSNQFPNVTGIGFNLKLTGSSYLAEYTISGNNGNLTNDYTLTSSVLLNNITLATTGSDSEIVYYTKP